MMVRSQTTSHNPAPPALLAAFKRIQERNRELEAFIRWEDELFSNAHLSGNHKLAIRATRRAVQRAQTHDEQGRARINLTTIAQQIGISPDTMSRGLKLLKQCGVIADHDLKPEIQENGERWTRHYITLNEDLLAKPKEIQPPTPRNHGGNRYHCQKCGSDQVRIQRRVTLVCTCCQHESVLEERECTQEPEPSNQAQAIHVDEQGGNLQDILKPVSSPDGAACGDDDPSEPGEVQTEQADQADLWAAAEFLLALAGQTDEHIQMSRTGKSKYYTVKRPLSLQDTFEHLQGGQARGTTCSRPDGRTRGLCWDADEAEGWDLLQRAARQLADAGSLAILEESPAGRGGHLWILYDALVSAAAARHHAQWIAPDLATLGEYWPPAPEQAQRWNKVRLPGARYVRRGQYVDAPIYAWCRLVSVAEGEISERGQADAARFLLSHQTSASIVAAAPANSDQDETDLTCDVAHQQPAPLHLLAPLAGTLPTSDDQAEQESKMHLGSQVDWQWDQTYNTPEGKRLWFAFTPQFVAAWWNEQHHLEELRPRERNGMAYSPNGEERTPSTAYRMTPDGERYTDFSANGRRSDGTHDTGDALELHVRLAGAPKPDVLRSAASELQREARQALESAARSGQPVPAWLTQILTDAGREHYARVASQAGHLDQAHASTLERQVPAVPAIREQRGLPGFSPPRQAEQESTVPPDNNKRPLTEAALTVSAEAHRTQETVEVLDAEPVDMHELEMIRDYGRAHQWVALVIDGEEIIPAGRADWLDFVWLSHQKEQQHRVFEYIKGRSPLP